MGGRHGGQHRRVRRVDLLGVDEVPDGTMKMAWVDGTDQVLVVNTDGAIRAMQGICSHEYFELDKGFLTAGTLTCALHLSRFDLADVKVLPEFERALKLDDGVLRYLISLHERELGAPPMSEEEMARRKASDDDDDEE